MVNLSPTAESYNESLSAMKFASMVNKCELGKAKKHIKEYASGPSKEVAKKEADEKMRSVMKTLPARKSRK